MFLGRLNATTFQVVGHMKTVLVLIGGVLFFHETVVASQTIGVAMAVAGMSIYSFTTGGGK